MISFIAAIFGASHMSVVTIMPPLSSTFLPFSRTVTVAIAWWVSKPLIVFFSPVFLTSKSTSICFAFGSAAAGLSFSRALSLRASSSAFFCASSMRRRSSAKVVTL